jgi:hypothetical protein
MFRVEITADAKAALEAKLSALGMPQPGVMIGREGARADVSRSKTGGTTWNIDRPANPWRFDLASFEKYPDAEYQMVNGIRVYLALIPRQNEKGVVILVKNGELTIEALGT